MLQYLNQYLNLKGKLHARHREVIPKYEGGRGRGRKGNKGGIWNGINPQATLSESKTSTDPRGGSAVVC